MRHICVLLNEATNERAPLLALGVLHEFGAEFYMMLLLLSIFLLLKVALLLRRALSSLHFISEKNRFDIQLTTRPFESRSFLTTVLPSISLLVDYRVVLVHSPYPHVAPQLKAHDASSSQMIVNLVLYIPINTFHCSEVVSWLVYM